MQIKQGVLRAAAAATVTVLMAAGAAAPAYATGDDDQTTENGTTCNKLGYTKIDQPSGSADLEFGSLEWGGDTLTYVVDEGYTVDLCIKSGSKAPITEFTVTGADEGSREIAQDISHIGYLVAEAPEEETPAEETPEEEAPEDEAPAEETPEEEAPEDEAPAEETPAEEAPEDEAPAEEAPEEEAPEEAAPAEETADTDDAEVLGVEASRGTPETGTAADVAPEEAGATGFLPATGAGSYGLPILAGLGLLTAGGVLLARRRKSAGA